jgi:hypothetical protein
MSSAITPTSAGAVVAIARSSIPAAAVFRLFSLILFASNIPIPQPIAVWEIVSNVAEGSESATVL